MYEDKVKDKNPLPLPRARKRIRHVKKKGKINYDCRIGQTCK
jgi:hypothetical protein